MSQSETQCCETTSGKECAVEKSIKQGCCPVEGAVEMWQQAFFQAIKGTQVDILKEKIRKEWGPMMDKEANAVIKAMGAQWQAMISQAKAQVNLREEIKDILCEGTSKK